MSHSTKSKSGKHSQNKLMSAEELVESYKKLAPDIWDKTWDILATKTGWAEETSNHNLESGIIHSQRFHGHHAKVFRLEGYVDASPEDVFEETVIKVEETPKWNTTVQECITVQVIDDNTDISHNITNEAVGGLVSSRSKSGKVKPGRQRGDTVAVGDGGGRVVVQEWNRCNRDFVNLRHWKTKDGILLSAGCSVLHPSVPPSKKHVRGDNGPGGWFYRPCPHDPNRCIFGWIVNTDIKGWIPSYLVEQAIHGELLQFLKNLRQHMNRVKAEREPGQS